MSDLISRQAAIDALDNLSVNNVPNADDYLFVLKGIAAASDCIETLPAVQPERKHGKWERHYSRPNVYADLFLHCSACGYKSAEYWTQYYNFCPECGADMRGGDNT